MKWRPGGELVAPKRQRLAARAHPQHPSTPSPYINLPRPPPFSRCWPLQVNSIEVSLTAVWNAYSISWPILVPPTAIDTPFAPDQLMTIQFEAPAPDPFDFWIDDVSFQPVPPP
jgi:hypothetical protein